MSGLAQLGPGTHQADPALAAMAIGLQSGGAHSFWGLISGQCGGAVQEAVAGGGG